MQLVRREEALNHCSMFLKSALRVLLVEARAGQGKTVLGTQLADSCGLPVAWCSCSKSDTDPARLYLKILDKLHTAAPSFDYSRATSALYQRLTADELPLVAGNALKESYGNSGSGALVVIDDAHLLASSLSSLKLLRSAIKNTPLNFKFAILSRWPLSIEQEPLVPPSQSFCLDNEMLAFNRAETSSLLNDVMQIPATGPVIADLVQSTGGWVAALRLAARDTAMTGAPPENITGSLRDLMLRQTLDDLDAPTRRGLLLASELPDIPEEFAETILPKSTLAHLANMAAHNFFIRTAYSASGKLFVMHHILGDELRKTGQKELPQADIQRFLAHAASWFRDKGQTEEALDCAAKSYDFRLLSDILKESGIDLMASNRTRSLKGILQALPTEMIAANGWLSLFYGFCLYHHSTPESLPHLEKASELFRSANDPRGELLSLAKRITYHAMVDGRFGRYQELVLRGLKLYEATKSTLPPIVQLFSAQALAMGAIHYLANPTLGTALCKEVSSICLNGQLRALRGEVELTSCLNAGIKGDVRNALKGMERSFELLNDPTVAPSTQCGIEFMHLNYAAMYGQFNIYDELRSRLSMRHEDILNKSYLGAFIVIWDLDKLVAENKLQEALSTAEGALASAPTEGAEHLTSQFLHYKALALALSGNTDEAKATALVSYRQRTYAGGKYFRSLNFFLLGTALWQSGLPESGERSITHAIKTCKKFNEISHRAGAHLYRALIRLEDGRLEQALSDLREGLSLIRANKNVHFFGWHAPLVLKALATAVKHNIHPDLAAELAQTRLRHTISNDGKPIPLLLFDDLSEPSLHTPDGKSFSPAGLQKELLGILASAPSQCITVQDATMRIWPETPTHKARPKFDTLLLRLRKTIRAKLGQDAGKNLVLRSGSLRQEHTRILSDQMLFHAREGITYARASQPYASHRAFLAMDQIWEPETRTAPLPTTLENKIKEPLAHAYGRWAALLHANRFHTDALAAVEVSLRLEPFSDRNQKLRHNLLAKLGRPGEASLSLKRYKSILLEEGFSEEEASETIEALLN